ncbi:MAG: hypothetical protein JWQ48_2175 [Conexibacter sp.]|nr:hypothetical protein [Conexibacter sp.]
MSSQRPEVVNWRSEWAEAERLADSSPEQALGHYDRAIAGLLEENGYQLAGAERSTDYDLLNVARGLDPEVVFMYMEAHAILAMQDDGRKVGVETMALAFEAYRTVLEIVEEAA